MNQTPTNIPALDRQAWHPTVAVAADGTIVAGELRGSIHQVGAAVQNTPSCNGWLFWHIEREGKLVALDVLRSTP